MTVVVVVFAVGSVMTTGTSAAGSPFVSTTWPMIDVVPAGDANAKGTTRSSPPGTPFSETPVTVAAPVAPGGGVMDTS